MYALPPDLVKRHDSIMDRFDQVSDDWKKYADEVIPEDSDFAREILLFCVDALTFYEKNYETTKQTFWSEFVYSFPGSFSYGPSGDDYNYLSFDESAVFEMFMDLWDKDTEIPSLIELQQFKKKVIEAYKRF